MKFSVFLLWRPTLLLLLGLFLPCEARVNTEIQAGPLYRVVGSRLAISCNTSGFPNPNSKKHFEFRMIDSVKQREINIMSTQDPDFSYSRFSSRVESKDISVTYVDSNSVIFEIKELLKEDDGEYECSVINPEAFYDGVYTKKTVVKVIDNSLSVATGDTTTLLSYDEGEALSLTCQSSTSTIQHVHLSFAWYLRKDGAQDAKPVISLDRYFTLTPGQGFEQRYREEAVSLDKLGETTYRLKIAELQLSDQGQIYCQAQEWIQDPDRSWYMIAQKDAEEITLKVKPKVVTDASSVDVSLSAQNALQEGQELLLSCTINAQNLAGRFFSIAWLWGEAELVRIGPTGILTVNKEFSDRVKDGELRAMRTGNNNYQLRLKPVRTTNGGNYICRAWPEERGEDGSFSTGAAQDSQPVEVKISTEESGLSIKMKSLELTVSQGERLRLNCDVDGVKGQLSVTWQRKSMLSESPLSTSIISLSQNGVTEKAEAFASRKVRVTREVTETMMESFVFELDEVAPYDSGAYECVVSETQTNGKTQSQLQSAKVTVNSIDSLMKVSLKSRDPAVTVGEKVDLICKVSRSPMPLAVIWSQQTNGPNPDTIVTVNSDGSISWSGDQHRYQVEVEKKNNAFMHHLKIIGASHREAGTYQCMVSVSIQNVYQKPHTSNPLKVIVYNPVSKLALNSNPPITQNINTDIQIECKVTSRSSDSSLYAVTWILQQEAGNKTILSSNRNSLITFGPQIEENHRQRISMSCTFGPTFKLTIRHARFSDKGVYLCKVEEYLQEPQGEWYSLSNKTTSTNLNIVEPDTNLSIENIEADRNVSIKEDFTINCHITQQSSNESQFQVTWFWQKGANVKPIFTVYRNSTLQENTEGIAVRYDHPLPGKLILTVLSSTAENSGLYFCEVEEWVYSLAYGWRKVAVEKSGNLNVNVDAQGTANAVAAAACMADIWMAVFAVTVVISLCAIAILVLKMCRTKTSRKKTDTPLWAEQHSLDPKSVF